MSKPDQLYDPDEIALQKQVSRDRDQADLDEGRKTLEDLDRENNVFYGVGPVEIDF